MSSGDQVRSGVLPGFPKTERQALRAAANDRENHFPL
jgi:hypothetical protein